MLHDLPNHPTRSIALTIIGGYLGAGKTTLLNHILRAPHGRRLAVLVNDFGAINIDAALIAKRDGDTIQLANGCICCSLMGSLMATLLELKQRANPPEHIIIEASGVADPHKLAQYGLGGNGLELESVLVVADAETIRQRSRDKYVGRLVVEQLRAADLLILTKTDLITAEQSDEVRAWIMERAPHARVLTAVNGNVPLEMILGIRLAQHNAFAAGDAPTDKHAHDAQFENASFVSAQPLDGQALRNVLAKMPKEILRAKGILALQEDLAHRYILQVVGARVALTRDVLWGEDVPQTQLVAIGLAGQGAAEKFVRQLDSMEE